VRISRADYDELIAHAREAEPEECCGVARLNDGRVEEVVRGTNTQKSRKYGFEIDYATMMTAIEWEDDGFAIASYHSHPRSAAEPSQQDRNVAQYPAWLNLIVSLEDDPHVRAWWIVDGDVREEPLEID
jgi:[CysO sulfur-carrier protein]-S-L-cysteine hydrolase